MIRILYVDDESGLLMIGKLFLEKSDDFSVDVIDSAPKAIQLLKEKSYDIIISDYQMPGMNGIEFLKYIHPRCSKIPFILFTGRGREDVVIEALNNGAVFYLQKGGDPLSQFAELAHKIRIAVERQRSEKALLESEEKLTTIIDFIPDATAVIDQDKRVIFWNRAMEELTGIPKMEMIGKGDYAYSVPFYGERRPILIDYVFLPEQESVDEFYSSIKQKGEILIAETDLPCPLGEPKTLLGKAQLLYDKNGEVIGAIETIRDISAQKKTIIALKQSEEQFRSLAEDLPGCICSFLPDSTVTYVNPALAEMAGKRQNEIIGTKFFELMADEEKENLIRALESLTPQNPVKSHVQSFIDTTGNTHHLEWKNRAFFGENGVTSRFLAIGIEKDNNRRMSLTQ